MEKKHLRKITKVTIAGALAISLIVASLFSSPQELITPEISPAPVVMDVNDFGLSEDAEDEAITEEEKRKSFTERLKERLQSFPMGVRTILGIPAWFAGWGILSLFTWLGNLLIIPAAGAIIQWLGITLAVLTAAVVSLKLLFPNLPLKELLRPRNILAALVGAGILTLVKPFIPLVWENYEKWAGLVNVIAYCGLTFIIALIIKRQKQ